MSHAPSIHGQLDSGERRETPAAPGNRSLANVLAARGLPLNTRCGQRGWWPGCEAQLLEGALRCSHRGPSTRICCTNEMIRTHIVVKRPPAYQLLTFHFSV